MKNGRVSNLSFAESSHISAHIVLYWEHIDGRTFPGSPGPVYARTKYPPTGTIAFDEDELWNINPVINLDDEIDLPSVALHEIGHALGLGHSNESQSVMFGSTLPGTTIWRELRDDDIAGIQALYGPLN